MPTFREGRLPDPAEVLPAPIILLGVPEKRRWILSRPHFVRADTYAEEVEDVTQSSSHVVEWTHDSNERAEHGLVNQFGVGR